MAIASQYSTSIPELWELDGWDFMLICSIMIEESAKMTGTSSGPALSIESLQNYGKFMESVNVG